MRVHALASEPHFLRHLLPVWRALPAEVRGDLVAPSRLTPWADGEPLSWQMPPRGEPMLVASHGDLRRARGRPVAYMEHGTGQTYLRRHNSYAGGPSRPGVGLFLCQSDRVAAINEDAHPHARQAVVGTPYLDGVHRTVRSMSRLVVSFHWDCPVVPETRSAWRHYMQALPALRAELAELDVELAGHAHPRMWPTVAPWYARHGITPVEDFREVLATADCYAVDNSSTLYEAAAVGIPVVALNAPWYRREVNHGLRFWSLVPGPQVDGPAGLVDAAAEAFHSHWRTRAARIAQVVYHRPAGGAARAAAAAVVEWLAAGAPRTQEANVEDRSAHDPYAPKRRVTRKAPVASTETSAEPARRDGGTPPVQTAPEPDDGTVASQVPTSAEAAVEYVDAAQSDADERERAQAVWQAELTRAPSDRRVTVQRRVSRVLEDVPDPDQVPPEDTDNVPGDTLLGDTSQEAPGSPESADGPSGSGDTGQDASGADADAGDTQDG